VTIALERPTLTTEDPRTPESVELARINADLAAIEARMDNPHGWAKLLEDQRAVLLGRRAELLAGRIDLTATSVLGA
jgi:hypothetical protein